MHGFLRTLIVILFAAGCYYAYRHFTAPPAHIETYTKFIEALVSGDYDMARSLACCSTLGTIDLIERGENRKVGMDPQEEQTTAGKLKNWIRGDINDIEHRFFDIYEAPHKDMIRINSTTVVCREKENCSGWECDICRKYRHITELKYRDFEWKVSSFTEEEL